MQLLLDHDYPGNVRELLNLVEQTVILCRSGEIGVDLLPGNFIAKPATAASTSSHNGCPSREVLEATLQRYEGNRTHTAREFGVDRTTLWRWMKRLGLLGT